MREFRTLICLLLVSTLVSCAPGAHEEPASHDSPEAYADSVLSAAFDRWGYFGTENSVETDTLLPGLVAEMLADPASMKWGLDSLQKHVQTTYSDDGRIRVLWWFHPGTGTMRRYQSVVSYVDAGGGIRHFPDEAEYPDYFERYAPGSVRSLYHLRDSLYLALGAGRFSGTLPYRTADIVSIDTSRMTRSTLDFHVREGSYSQLMLDISWYFEDRREYGYQFAEKMFEYDSSSRILTFPTVSLGSDRIFYEVYGTGSGVAIDETRPIRMRWVDTGFVEMSGGGVK